MYPCAYSQRSKCLRWFFYSVLLVPLSLLQVSCDSAVQRSNWQFSPEDPDVEGETLELVYTRAGRLEMLLRTPKLVSYSQPDKTYDEFPQGIFATTYNDSGQLSAYITAKYAIYQRNGDSWEARHDVVIVNEKRDTLQTERLFWDVKTKRFYSEENVRIKTDVATLYGQGFESDDRFVDWVIKKPTGTFLLQSNPDTAVQSGD